MSGDTSQRLDRWLWCARMFKTRALASAAIAAQGVRISRNGQTQATEKASFAVRPGDVLAFARGERIFVLEVLSLGVRRGPATEAATLYKDQSPPPPPKKDRPALMPQREPGSGRPTKRERRALEQLKGNLGDNV